MADYVPALKARMGDWQYYVTVMKLGKIARECQVAEVIHVNKGLDDLIQRDIQDRVHKEMVPYLLHEPQRFYGALVVAVYGGDPSFSPVKVAEHELLDDKDSHSYGFGLLRFDGSQIYYALDGQHRLKSIQEAISNNPDLAKEEISVIILKHEQTTDGLQRTRRLFSTLNRRAKPTSAGMNIAIDEDDGIAIVTRRLLRENEVLKNLVSTKLNSKTINRSKADYSFLTTLSAFYDTNEILLSAFKGGLETDKNFKQFRPSDQDLDAHYAYLENLWILMLNRCPGFDLILQGKKKPGDIRQCVDNNNIPVLNESGKPIAGGHIFARPMGQFIIAEVLRTVGIQGKSMEDAIDAIMNNVPMDINKSPWVRVIWNPSTQRIMGTKSERSLLSSMISHALGLRINTKIKDLKEKYRDTVEDEKASLLSPISWSGNSVSHESSEENN